MAEFHFLRPLWLFALILLGFLVLGLWRIPSAMKAWSRVCDAHLLKPLLLSRGQSHRKLAVVLMVLSMGCMIVALAGPTWTKFSVPTYQHIKPRLLLLDMSQTMLVTDFSPNRLTRAKFKIHDLLMQQEAGQFGLMVYTSEPFLVSPITDDAQTIDNLLTSLTPELMPVGGNRLDLALDEARTMLSQMGLAFADILVLTAQTPSPAAVDGAQDLAAKGYHVSIMPYTLDKAALPLFSPFAKAGHGEVIAFTDTPSDILHWLAIRHKISQYQVNQRDDVPLWRDEGRWFLLPGLVLLLPVFRRAWLERISP